MEHHSGISRKENQYLATMWLKLRNTKLQEKSPDAGGRLLCDSTYLIDRRIHRQMQIARGHKQENGETRLNGEGFYSRAMEMFWS